jgi:hypothetical protein
MWSVARAETCAVLGVAQFHDGGRQSRRWKQNQLRNGVVDLLLEPTEGATPAGVTYTARFSLVGSTGVTVENWAVPDSASPVNLAERPRERL